MNKLMPFSFESSSIRVVTKQDGSWSVVAKDVALALGYVWAGMATIGHVPEEWKEVNSVLTPGGIQNLLTLTEQGLYLFLARSDRPKAKCFLKEVISRTRLSVSNILDMFYDLDIPDQEEYFVYAIQEEETGNIKIGISKDPERRVRTLNTGNSHNLRLIHAVPAPKRFKDERLAHKRATGWIRGEWFSCTEQQAIENLAKVAA